MKHRTEEFLADAPYQFVFTPTVSLLKHEVKIRDKNDYPILPSAIISGMDILITGDKDFQDVVIDKPIILTPTEFLNEKY
jgi:predicted nucleic acid-binding protein